MKNHEAWQPPEGAPGASKDNPPKLNPSRQEKLAELHKRSYEKGQLPEADILPLEDYEIEIIKMLRANKSK